MRTIVFSALRAARAPSAALFCACLWYGCLPSPALEPRGDAGPRDGGSARDAAARLDAPDAPLVLALAVTDARGAPWPVDAAPRRPRLWLTASRDVDVEGALFVLEGAPDEALRTDLESAPLRAEHLARAMDIEVLRDGRAWALSLPRTLAPGQAVTVAVGGWVDGLATPFVAEVRASTEPRAGAALVASWPPEGASTVPTALPLAALRFDGALEPGSIVLSLQSERGERVPATIRGARCEEIGWPDGDCVALLPERALAPALGHALVLEAARDATGAALPTARIALTTGASEGPLPAVLASTCALDETAVGGVCVLADDAMITLRAQVDAPVRAWLEGAGRNAGMVAPRGALALSLDGLGPMRAIDATLRLLDLSGREQRLPLALATTEPLATIAITEIRADPHGAEPRQEFVELANYGDRAVSLAGMRLADSTRSEGDAIPEGWTLAPGARALLVGEGFDPDDATDGDATVPAGIALVVIDRSLGSGGLTNAGEPLFLRDAMDRRVSAAPAMPAREGVCSVRTADDPRTGAASAFDYDAAGSCTPGR